MRPYRLCSLVNMAGSGVGNFFFYSGFIVNSALAQSLGSRSVTGRTAVADLACFRRSVDSDGVSA